ncbi:general secretion pathway protein K [Marinobacter persicus]|uniref:Type II secretion system protein K n=1 Tax=Marinobacter persicus TaxID=930118 RepID=A0A1I3WBF5_9GAMM|nr:type II secretion system minor pseudopilin GspK [Marinobacter persicus]GHD47270.1 type II secretion system protein K [Marinobacter persicus]SFK04792.1 general secretion pathway protein K [Marinobacter persicus]
MSARNSQQGVALIMVLLAMALVVMLAAGMVRQQSLQVFKAGHYLAQQQGYSIALGAEAFARQVLKRDFEEDRESGVMADSLDEFWAMRSAVLPLDENGVAEVQIDGLGGRLNLNDLVSARGEVDSLARGRFERLLQVLGITGLRVDALIDWIDENDEPLSSYGAEDGTYLMAQPSFRAANQPFVSVTELRLIEGMTEVYYQQLLPHVTALPDTGIGINVNTATGPVLQSLHENLTEAAATTIIAKREESRFEDIRAFLSLPELSGTGLSATGLTLQTRFFDVVSRITYDDRVVNLVSRVFRSAEGEVRTVHRDSGQKNRITREPYIFSGE